MCRKKSAEMEIRMEAKVKEYSEQVETGAKVKLGTSDKIIRGFGYIFVTIYAVCYSSLFNHCGFFLFQ